MSDTVKVKALKYHTHAGKEYQAGATYTVEADQLDNLLAQRMVERVDAPQAPVVKPSKPVEPMTTDDFKKTK